jgi:feruloyl esterase
LIAYYQRLGQANGGPEATAKFARLFLVPGMTHCRGGKSLDTFDPLGAVVDWAENGEAPPELIATGQAFPGRSRPICAYPKQSRYRGSGSIEDAQNFECKQPE